MEERSIMRKLAASGIFAAAAAATAFALSAPPAFATSWHVSNGGSISAQDPDGTELTAGSQTLVCDDPSDGTGTVLNADPANPTPIGTIDTLNFSGCHIGIFNFEVDTTGNQPWNLNAVSYNSTTHVTTGTITGVTAALSGPLCTADVTGPGGAPGSVDATYDNDTGVLSVAGGGNLVLRNVSGCGGLITNDQAAGFHGDYSVSPVVQITATEP
jgi:hypothetical protein